MSNVIQMMWVGEQLSPMEQISLSSFVEHGHDVHLYTYGDVKNIPSGVVVKDGNEILSEDMIFQYTEHKSFSAFSNFFRYKLLYDRGGWWIDTDVVCLRPFDFEEPYVFCSEEVLPLGQNNTHIGSCVMKAPVGSPVMKDAFDICMKKDRKKLVWGEIGPKMVKQMVEKYNMHSFVEHYSTFCPIPGCLWHMFLNEEVNFDFEKPEAQNVYAAHLWNEMWRRGGAQKEQSFHPNCFYEKLKEKYVV